MSKAITEHISLGTRYENVKKVYSINILYFDMGRGKDYLYHGTTEFIGVHTGDKLLVNAKEKGIVSMKAPSKVFPEYYLVRVNQFNDVAKTPIEEWLDYLKNEHIREDTTVPGLQEAREKLAYLHMSSEERAAYERHLDNLRIQNDVLSTARMEGWDEGMQKGMQKGIEKGMQEGMEKGLQKGMQEGMEKGMKEGKREGELNKAKEIARKMREKGMSADDIAEMTGLSVAEIQSEFFD